jgi:3-hydroxyacyl-CoA dehydrogenase
MNQRRKAMREKNIACLGAGPIGASWAIVFARAGHRVMLHDVDQGAVDSAFEYIQSSLADLSSEGLVPDEEETRSRIQPSADLEGMIGSADVVIECVTEKVEVKRKLMGQLAHAVPPDSIIASSTSAIPGSEFMDHPQLRGRCLVTHPTNPPHLIPVVEFCATPWTESWAFDACWELMKQSGLRPIKITREIPAFVVNRLQGALIGEALHLVDTGVVSIEDLDIALKHGFGRRLAITGPFESLHLNSPLSFKANMDKHQGLLRRMIDETDVKHEWSDGLLDEISIERDRILPPEQIAIRKTWRDRMLIKISKLWEEVEKTQA